MTLPSHVKIYEVGPRDGLQNEKQNVTTNVKVELIERLADTGINMIEATAFVSPDAVVQMADHVDVMAKIKRKKDVTYSVLVPNERGMITAIESGVREVAVFTSASEDFSQKNINCSIEESLFRFKPVISLAKMENIKVRGYVSCVIACPYEGDIDPEKVANISARLYEIGCYEISLGDTIGIATPEKTRSMIGAVSAIIPTENLALHFHDTYGYALDNLRVGLEEFGISTIDSSVGGLGGCPYAQGATGNVATEDVIHMLNGLGIETGVDLSAIIDTAWFISNHLGRKPVSKTANLSPIY